MKDAWIPVIASAAVAVISLAGAIYIKTKTERPMMSIWWNRIAAILVGAAVAVAADYFWHLGWYIAIQLGAIAMKLNRTNRRACLRRRSRDDGLRRVRRQR
jgi:hypothetical protein